MRPDRAEYELALARTDPERAVSHLRRAAEWNPYLTDARILMAAELERAGDISGSEATLLELAERDHLYAPPWALANFYVRTGQTARFWPWARAAAQKSPGDVRPLFTLAIALAGDGVAVLDRIVSPRRSVECQYLEFLLDRKDYPDADVVARRIATDATATDRNFLLEYVDRCLAAGRSAEAAEIWNRLYSGRLQALPDHLVNGDFSSPIVGRGFDWRPALPGCAVVAETNAGGPALELFLSGSQPENCSILDQVLRLSRGAAYEMRFQYRTTDLPDPTGLRWWLGGRKEYVLRASPEWSDAVWRFFAPDEGARLTLEYRRAAGSTRHQGTVLFRRARLERQPGS